MARGLRMMRLGVVAAVAVAAFSTGVRVVGATTSADMYPNCGSQGGEPQYLGDGICDAVTNNIEECGWDGGDCCECTCQDGPLHECLEGGINYTCMDTAAPCFGAPTPAPVATAPQPNVDITAGSSAPGVAGGGGITAAATAATAACLATVLCRGFALGW